MNLRERCGLPGLGVFGYLVFGQDLEARGLTVYVAQVFEDVISIESNEHNFWPPRDVKISQLMPERASGVP